MGKVETRGFNIEGLVGQLFLPEGPGPHPAAIFLGGSEGGVPRWYAELFVPRGVACLTVGYFGCEALPQALMEMPIERIEQAGKWLREQPDVLTHDGRVGIVGRSKGAELALVAAAFFPEVFGPVVSFVGTGSVWPGIDLSAYPNEARLRSAWSYQGVPLPFVPFVEGVTGELTAQGLRIRRVYEAALFQPDAVEAAAIPVERAAGPLLLFSGTEDAMWPSTEMSETVVARLERHGRGDIVKHLALPGCGHRVFRHPKTFVAPSFYDVGGTDEAADAAHEHVLRRATEVLVKSSIA